MVTEIIICRPLSLYQMSDEMQKHLCFSRQEIGSDNLFMMLLLVRRRNHQNFFFDTENVLTLSRSQYPKQEQQHHVD